MYNKFFGFKEKPFRLVPNPEYLFLSKSHEEALAHLTYAISHGDGFVEITGEVGTGKTTLCRVFLGSLDTSIDAAYIFNPKLDALQLLKAINDEFGIDSQPDNTKDLIDILNEFLIEKKAAGQKVLVLIDEAQNLSLEVLEQLRLLSNLETTQEKLLQIILVGQPELGDMLSSHQLRQLGQRITINCKLDPLTYQEAKDYIRHRISLASHRAGPPFDKGSYRAIYEFSKGIPRLINIACNRVLLNAFSRNSFKVTGSITKEAIKELKRKKSGHSHGWLQGRPGLIIIVSAFFIPLAIIMLYLFNGQPSGIPFANKTLLSSQVTQEQNQEAIPQIKKVPEPPEPVAPLASEPTVLQNEAAMSSPPPEAKETMAPADAIEQSGQSEKMLLLSPELPESDVTHETLATGPTIPVKQAPISEDAKKILKHLKSLNSRHSRNSSMKETLKLWFPAKERPQLKSRIESDPGFFQQAAKDYGLQVQPVATDSDITLIQNLNLPAIFTFYLPGHSWPKYLAVPYMNKEKIYFIAEGHSQLVSVDRDIFLQYWSGEAYISWKNYSELKGIITEHSNWRDITSLKKLLRKLGYDHVSLTESYDKETIKIIKDIQEKYGLHVDGLVGPFTKIALYNESLEFIKPSLVKFETARTENGS
jgi:general secretion pathway protein A